MRRALLPVQLRRLGQAIAEGRASQTVHQAIAEREAEMHSITDRLIEPGPGSLQVRLDELRDFALSRLQNLRKLLSRPERVTEARALLAEQVGKITVAPAAGERQYVAKGFVDFFGEEASRVGGGGGRDAPVQLPVRFTWQAA